jgi:hypothetical protein
MGQLSVDHSTETTHAIDVAILTVLVWQVDSAVSATNVALVAADAHGTAVEVVISIQIEERV